MSRGSKHPHSKLTLRSLKTDGVKQNQILVKRKKTKTSWANLSQLFLFFRDRKWCQIVSQSIFLFPKILFLASSFWTVSSGKVFSNEHESPIQSNSWNDETKQANICHCFIRLERMWVWTFQKCIGWFERSSQTAFEKIYFRACQRWQFEPSPKTLALLTHQILMLSCDGPWGIH